ncbi:hypothetical protein BD779DRAFT_131950 [Infundibulicybe gibba]|nr:hypothetical protein BD779DRAFT_131950 [Infundibulicybe gibba]
MLLGEVGKLREERRSLQYELGMLLSARARFNNEGDLVGRIESPKQSSNPPPPPGLLSVNGGWKAWSRTSAAPPTLPGASVDTPEPGLFGPKSPTSRPKGLSTKPPIKAGKSMFKAPKPESGTPKLTGTWGNSPTTINRPVPRRRGSSLGPSNKRVHFSPPNQPEAGSAPARNRSLSDAGWSPSSSPNSGWGGGSASGWGAASSGWGIPAGSDWDTTGSGWGETPEASPKPPPPVAPVAPPDQPAEPSSGPTVDRLSPITDFQTKADFDVKDNAEPTDILNLTPTEQQNAIRFPTLEPIVLSPRPNFAAPKPTVPFLIAPILRSSPEPQIGPSTEKRSSPPKYSPSNRIQDTKTEPSKEPENEASKSSRPASPQPPEERPDESQQKPLVFKPLDITKIQPGGAANLAADAKHYLHDFTSAIANEARLLANEIGRLREERQKHHDELGFILTIKSKYGPGGEFEPEWHPPYFPRGPPPPPPPPPASEPPDLPQAKPAWRSVSRKKKKKKPATVPPPPPQAPNPASRSDFPSWASWQPDPNFAPSPPIAEPTLLVPERGSPGLFGPRSPRSSF